MRIASGVSLPRDLQVWSVWGLTPNRTATSFTVSKRFKSLHVHIFVCMYLFLCGDAKVEMKNTAFERLKYSKRDIPVEFRRE
jgi:hypothetical protein